ncbi:ATP-binding protein [Paraherbaspirillum soli]|uniref:histidine kinase n=1 Tax=Paraherbaspirillum soli TaxID=631222 RepID=A0ABW0MEF0_9BURK
MPKFPNNHFARPSWARLGINSLFVVAMLGLAALGSHPAFNLMFGSIDKVQFDTVAQHFAHPNSHKVAVINIDEKTLRELGPKNLYKYYDPLFAQLTDAASVAIDILFVPYTPTGELAQAMSKNGKVVLPLSTGGTDGRGNPLVPPPPALQQAAAALGQRAVTSGHFGSVDGIIPYQQVGNKIYSHITLEAMRIAGLGMSVDALQTNLQAHTLSIATATTNSILLMLPRSSALSQYSYIDVVQGRVPATAFAGKIVFIGHSVFGEAGTFQTSSLNVDEVNRAQLDALLTEALVDGNMVRELSRAETIPIYLALALGMLLICALTPGLRMHLLALAWIVLLFAGSMLLLANAHIWLRVGVMPIIYALIYAFYAWGRLARTHRLLHHEIRELRGISAAVGSSPTLDSAVSFDQNSSDPFEEIKTAMRQIRAWQEAYVNVINLLPSPIFLEKDGQIALWNDKAAMLLGAEEIAQGSAGTMIPAIQECVKRNRGQEGPADMEIELNGRVHMLLSVPFAPFDPLISGDGIANLICLVDIADVKQTVSHDRQALRHMAHDLRNPLTTILALIEEQSSAAQPSGAGQDEKFIGELRRQVDYSLRVAQDFMQLSRAEQIDAQDFLPVSLHDLAAEAVDQVAPAAEQKSIALLAPEDTGQPLFLLGNWNMLMRSLVNVLDNAIKYSPPGSAITVRLARENGDQGELATIHVIDQGIGIPADALPHLFEPFFQVDGRHDGKTGIGLGLPFVLTVVERHGGTISVASHAGLGTDFRIALPLAVVADTA